jgi:hypothetical protein
MAPDQGAWRRLTAGFCHPLTTIVVINVGSPTGEVAENRVDMPDHWQSVAGGAVVGDDGVDGADGQLSGAGDGSDGLAVEVAGEDDAAFVGVDDAGPAAGAAAGSGGGEAVAGFADDVAAAVLDQRDRSNVSCRASNRRAFRCYPRSRSRHPAAGDETGVAAMSGKYMSGNEYSASLSAALNDYWQTLERRWVKDAGQTLRGGTSQINGAPSPARWQVPIESRGHLTTCPIVAWAVNDSTPANRPSADACDGWSVPDANYVECRAHDVLSQVGDWAWAKREQLATGVPDLAGGPELSSLEEARNSLVAIDGQMRTEGSVDAHTLPGLVGRLSGQDGNNNRAWMTGWTGLAANSLKGGFLSTVGPTLQNQGVVVGWLANCYSFRGTTIHAARNNSLHLIAQATRELTEAASPSTDTPTEKLAVNAVSQAWSITSTVIGALGSKAPGSVGTALTLIDFALNIREGKPNEGLRFPQLSDFFTHLDTAVRTLHSDLDKAEADYHKAIRAIEQEIASVDRTVLELYDITQHNPDGDDSDPSASGRFAVDVAVVLEIAQHCYDVAEIYSGLLNKIATASYADGQLAGRGVVPTAADTALVALRNDVESFFQKTTARYLMAGDRIKAAAKKYAEGDAEQKTRLNETIADWAEAGQGEYGQRNRIDLDPDKKGVQN